MNGAASSWSNTCWDLCKYWIYVTTRDSGFDAVSSQKWSFYFWVRQEGKRSFPTQLLCWTTRRWGQAGAAGGGGWFHKPGMWLWLQRSGLLTVNVVLFHASSIWSQPLPELVHSITWRDEQERSPGYRESNHQPKETYDTNHHHFNLQTILSISELSLHQTQAVLMFYWSSEPFLRQLVGGILTTVSLLQSHDRSSEASHLHCRELTQSPSQLGAPGNCFLDQDGFKKQCVDLTVIFRYDIEVWTSW